MPIAAVTMGRPGSDRQTSSVIRHVLNGSESDVRTTTDILQIAHLSCHIVIAATAPTPSWRYAPRPRRFAVSGSAGARARIRAV